jgi:hypothetical protein
MDAIAKHEGYRPPKASDAPATPSQANRRRDAVMLGVGMGAVARLLRDPRFHAAVITGVIGLGALAALCRDAGVHGLKRLIAWERQQDVRSGRKATVARRH